MECLFSKNRRRPTFPGNVQNFVLLSYGRVAPYAVLFCIKKEPWALLLLFFFAKQALAHKSLLGGQLVAEIAYH